MNNNRQHGRVRLTDSRIEDSKALKRLERLLRDDTFREHAGYAVSECGTAFCAYVIAVMKGLGHHTGRNPAEACASAYVGRFIDETEAQRKLLYEIGYLEGKAESGSGRSMFDAMPSWSDDAVWEGLDEHFYVISGDRNIYVFTNPDEKHDE